MKYYFSGMDGWSARGCQTPPPLCAVILMDRPASRYKTFITWNHVMEFLMTWNHVMNFLYREITL